MIVCATFEMEVVGFYLVCKVVAIPDVDVHFKLLMNIFTDSTCEVLVGVVSDVIMVGESHNSGCSYFLKVDPQLVTLAVFLLNQFFEDPENFIEEDSLLKLRKMVDPEKGSSLLPSLKLVE